MEYTQPSPLAVSTIRVEHLWHVLSFMTVVVVLVSISILVIVVFISADSFIPITLQ